jgi:predicted DNA-binding transcriptional regulator AlpA
MKDLSADDAVLKALRRFENSPDDARFRAPVVRALFGGISPATMYRRIADGTIPAPQKDGPRCNVWSAGVLRRALRGEAA